jgi:hypothetical protein
VNGCHFSFCSQSATCGSGVKIEVTHISPQNDVMARSSHLVILDNVTSFWTISWSRLLPPTVGPGPSDLLINMAFTMACPNFKKGLKMAFGPLGVNCESHNLLLNYRHDFYLWLDITLGKVDESVSTHKVVFLKLCRFGICGIDDKVTSHQSQNVTDLGKLP